MSIALQPKFPIPDRSKQTIHLTKDEDGVIDIGWCDGVLSDGRAYRAEMWAEDQISLLTIFFSSIGMEEFDTEQIRRLIQIEGLVSFVENGQQRCTALKFTDDAGNGVWSLNSSLVMKRRLSLLNQFRSFHILRSENPIRCSIQFRSKLLMRRNCRTRAERVE